MVDGKDELTAPCGRYCGDCGICSTAIDLKMTALAGVYDATGIRKGASELGWDVMRGMAVKACADFDSDLKSFSEWTRKCFPQNCRHECVPPCGIPACCANKRLDTCADCPDYEKCDKPNLKKNEENVRNIKEIKKNGLAAFSKRKRGEMVSRIKNELSSAVMQSIS